MALFERENDKLQPDLNSQALSVSAIENDFIEGVYDKLATVYDVFFGPILHPGRLLALQRMDIQSGDRVLEVGVGTGINSALYPHTCHVTAIDFSASMLAKARGRVSRKGLHHVTLMEMDAAALTFADESFDVVYAPYLVNCVSDPLEVVREMHRVCKPGGKIVLLNHFRSTNWFMSRVDRVLTPLTVHIGFKSDLDLSGFLAQTGLQPVSIEKVISGLWSLVICRRD
jgi:phosphatidylethanolamine/phosphatidyl-N-methylethanolamine N-methyltransferase